MTTTPHGRLAKRMNERRVELGMMWKDVAAAAGMSESALRSIRLGLYRPSDLTARDLDAALRWKHGSVMRVLGSARGAPTPLTDDAERIRATAPLGMRMTPERRALLEELEEHRARVDEIQRELGEAR